ncbi:MAG TPA: hypothetical protein VFR67_04490 [Pilimelia sp.]|nr:hypothetical protein [Pilimelia sp.]
MDAAWFDNLTRAVGQATSRRRALALFLGGTAGLMVPLGRSVGGAWAQQRPGTPAVRPTLECTGGNTLPMPCHEVDDYLQRCGMVCPNGELTNAYGCTIFRFNHERDDGPITPVEDPFGRVCFAQTVTVSWLVLENRSSRVELQPTSPCCPDDCWPALAQWHSRVDEHETGHRVFNETLIRDAQARWGPQHLTGCGQDQFEAQRDLLRRRQNLQSRIDTDRAEIRRQADTFHPVHPGGPPCGPCQQRDRDCDYCHAGTCRRNSCGPDESCCQQPNGDPMCCWSNEHCCSLREGGGCCPAHYQCCLPEQGGNCCRPGYVCCGFNQCCPASHPVLTRDPVHGLVGRRAGSRHTADFRPAIPRTRRS